MQRGKIVRIMDKGYGFIKYEGSQKDLFFHSKELKNAQFNDLRENDEVEFEIAESPKGPNAINVSKI